MPDERHFVTAGLGSGCVRIRETDSYRERMTLPVSGRDVVVHPDGQRIAASTLKDVRVYQVNLNTPNLEQMEQAAEFIKQLRSEDSGIRDNAVALLQALGPCTEPLLNEAMQSTTEPPTDLIRTLWEEMRSPTPIAVLKDLKGEVRQIVFSPTGSLLATSTITGEVRIWNTEEWTSYHQFLVTIP